MTDQPAVAIPPRPLRIRNTHIIHAQLKHMALRYLLNEAQGIDSQACSQIGLYDAMSALLRVLSPDNDWLTCAQSVRDLLDDLRDGDA